MRITSPISAFLLSLESCTRDDSSDSLLGSIGLIVERVRPVE